MLEHKVQKKFYLEDVKVDKRGLLCSKDMDNNYGHNLVAIMVFLRDILEDLHLDKADMILDLTVYTGKEMVNLKGSS